MYHEWYFMQARPPQNIFNILSPTKILVVAFRDTSCPYIGALFLQLL